MDLRRLGRLDQLPRIAAELARGQDLLLLRRQLEWVLIHGWDKAEAGVLIACGHGRTVWVEHGRICLYRRIMHRIFKLTLVHPGQV